MLGKLPPQKNENVLVGFDKGDDAGVYRIAPDLALVQTVDFFTPIVDDPFTFGEIAAANSLSDVYAMGGKPISALSIVAFPGKGETEILEQILLGGYSKMEEAGCAVIGGHSVADEELKCGYAVTGTIHPARVLSNASARAGDTLLLTKRLGTGVIATALKKGKASEESVAAAIDSMKSLNRAACEILARLGTSSSGAVHSITDITGFGMLGHAREMAQASEVTIELDHSRVAALPGALDAIRQGFLPGGMKNNREFASCSVSVTENVPAEIESLMYDPQTSGGLLIALSSSAAAEAETALREAGVPVAIVGRVTARGEHAIVVL